MRIRNRSLGFIMAVLMLAAGLTGCSRELTPKDLISHMSENMSGITSFSNEVTMDIELVDVVHSTKVSLDMELENTTEPKAGHAKGTAKMQMRGIELSSDMEVYQVEENGEAVTYSSTDNVWSREVIQEGAGSSGFSIDNNLFKEIEDSLDTFSIAKQTVELDGIECWQMYGDVKGENLIALLGAEMMNAYGLVEIPNRDLIAELNIPIIFEVYKEEVLPARMIVDMTDVMNNLFAAFDNTEEVENYTIKLKFKDYDNVGQITVPQEVKDAAG